MTAHTEVRDYVIWSKHLHGDLRLPARIEALEAGETIELEVDGVAGTWRKMDQGKDGRPTPGIRPLGSAQAFWRDLYRSRRGAVVTVSLTAEREGARRAAVLFPALGRTAEERQAALEALLAMQGQGWRSDGSGFDRDEAHDR
ncbi:hypothetical protein [Brevundimonas sp.]|uniref:hypothetical protein n=1 Tax=Brevundimonas sp. TaxID=1871086 RepID=UPI002737FAFC|nr:hypothetical protein [Brevundimonas sp.]MDP3801427.1 hypothetical protein [Brevundimonas sp.]